MAEFSADVDIANRALQYCGDLRLSTFADATVQAREIAFAYDKLRVAELQRNIWKFATKRVVLRPVDVTTLELVPAAWSAANRYIMGSVVAYKGLSYICRQWLATGTAPDASPTPWTPYFGPLTVSPYTAGTAYFAGELVYSPSAENYAVYVALANTSDVPGTFPPWSATAIYSRGQTISFGQQLQFFPGLLPVFFTPGHLPVNGNTSFGQSLKDLNTGNNPSLFDGINWQEVPAAGQPDYLTGDNWLRLDATIRSIVTPYPLSAGPCSNSETLNVYRLPNGYLRHAPADPKTGLVQVLGGPTNAPPSDMVFESGYIVTAEHTPFTLRFIADMTDVTQMDAMFCEGLAARIAEDVGPSIIPKEDRRAALARIKVRYKEVIAEARQVDAVERGATVTPLDPYIACRV